MRIRARNLMLGAAAVLVAAMAASPPAFEVASIRPQPWTNEGGVFVYVRGNTLYGEQADLYSLVDFAYGLRPDYLQLSGGPAWAKHGVLSNVSGGDSLLYQVIARAPEGSTPSIAQFREMLQALLADRFQLRVHHAMKDLAVFRLVIAKDGPKLTESAAGAKNSLALNDYGGKAFRMAAVHVRLSSLVEELAYATGKPVIDQTGLAGFYDFEIAWSPKFANDDVASAGLAEGPSLDPQMPPVFTAVERRLGLKLEPGTAPYDTVVIDHAEKPSAN
jgi:uncharacterized protein (TIGR03435 family)